MPERPSSGSALRVLFAVQQGPLSPGPRYRVFQFLPHFSRAGIDCTVLEMQSSASTLRSIHCPATGVKRLHHAATQMVESWTTAARLVRQAPHFDRLYIHRVPLPGWAAERLVRYRSRILFDVDDAWDAAEVDGSPLARLRQRLLRRSLERAVRISSVLVVSNARNARVVTDMGGHAEVVPTVVDLDGFTFRDRATGPTAGMPVIGWIGTPSTSRYLPAIEPVLEQLAARRRVAVRLVGSGTNPFRALPADVREWSLATETREIDAFDIGIMPMPDTQWTRGKAALKALQYGAAGAPTVASWTPTNEAILGSDQGAVLCRTGDEWIAALVRLVDAPQLRGEIGRKARRIVEERYSLQRCAPRLAALIVDPAPIAACSAAGLS